MIWLLLGCDTDREEWECVGPLVELVKWRDGVEMERVYEGKVFPDLAAREDAKLKETVAALKERRRQCEMTWSILSMQEADNPGLQLRARAIEELTKHE